MITLQAPPSRGFRVNRRHVTIFSLNASIRPEKLSLWGRYIFLCITTAFREDVNTYSGESVKSSFVLAGVREHLSWKDKDIEDPVPAEAILEATRDFDLKTFQALAEERGFRTAHDFATCRESGLHFLEDKPFSSWKVDDPIGTMTRSIDPARAAALLAIRENIEPEVLKEWHASAFENDIPSL